MQIKQYRTLSVKYEIADWEEGGGGVREEDVVEVEEEDLLGQYGLPP